MGENLSCNTRQTDQAYHNPLPAANQPKLVGKPRTASEGAKQL